MNSDIKSIEQRVCKMLMEKLPFPAKETFLIAYNRGWGNRWEVDESNPFCGLFILKWKLEKDTTECEKLTGVFARKHPIRFFADGRGSFSAEQRDLLFDFFSAEMRESTGYDDGFFTKQL